MKIMKYKTNILLQCLMALTVWAFLSCDDTMGGDADATSSLNFPADTVIVAVPGEIVAITFDVAYNWKVTSNKEWCLVDGEKTKYTSGKPGVNTVKYVIGDAVDPYVGDEAVITMTMEGTSSEVAHIVCRPIKEYGILVKDKDRVYANGESIIIGTSGELELNLDTPFKIEELGYKFPTEWLDVQIGETTMTLQVKQETKKYIVNNELDSLCLFKEGVCRNSFHIRYKGMDSLVAIIDGQIEDLVIRAGKRAYVNDVLKEMPIAFTVSALNDEYQVMSWAYDAGGYSELAAENRWFELTDDGKGKICLSVTEENVGKERAAVLWAFPKAVADSLAEVGFETSLYENTEDGWAIKEDAKQYLLTQVTQYGSTVTISPEAQWGLKVSVDGKTYTTSINSKGAKEAPVKALITADYGYKLLHVSYENEIGCTIIPEESSWLKVTDNGRDSIEVRFDRNVGNMRTAYLLALPIAVAEDEENLAVELFIEDQVSGLLELRDEAVKYVVAQFTQEAEEESSMSVIDANNWKYLAVEHETEQKWLDMAAAHGISPNKVFKSRFMGFSFMLNPLFVEGVWDPGDSERNDRIEVYSESGDKYKPGKIESGDDYEAEPTKMEEEFGDYMLMQFTMNSDSFPLDEYFIIYFVSDDDVYLKALVVYNYFE